MREPIATYYYSGEVGLEIYEWNDEYITYRDLPWDKWHRSKIYTDSSRAYFRWGNIRVHLDECVVTF